MKFLLLILLHLGCKPVGWYCKLSKLTDMPVFSRETLRDVSRVYFTNLLASLKPVKLTNNISGHIPYHANREELGCVTEAQYNVGLKWKE